MLPVGIDFASIQFGAARLLRLLAVPGGLLALWVWQLARRRRDRRLYARSRTVPVRERIPLAGGLLFWLCLIAATSLVVVALSRPRAAISAVRTAGIDLIVLQDGSASMRVADVEGSRWQRSIQFLRTLAESVTWEDDRLAMAVFAKLATPQIRLTKDPNTMFFFLDHLKDQPPLRLEDNNTWDTNIESGIYWGMRLIEKDEELHGKSKNAKAFVLVSDGQAWSGDVERSLRLANARDFPVWVVGVGTSLGGYIPEAPPEEGSDTPTRIRATLDRDSLIRIGSRGGGAYYQLGQGDDRTIANQIVDRTRRRAGSIGVEERADELYWRFLAAAAGFICLGVLSLRERGELWMQAAGAAVILEIISSLTR